MEIVDGRVKFLTYNKKIHTKRTNLAQSFNFLDTRVCFRLFHIKCSARYILSLIFVSVDSNWIAIFREKATSALAAGFHAGPGRIAICSVGFHEGRKTGLRTRRNRRTQSKPKTRKKLNPHMTPGRNQNPGLIGSRRSLSPMRHLFSQLIS